MKIEIEILDGKLFYRHRSGEKGHGTYERPLLVSDLVVIGKVVGLCEELFSRRNDLGQVEAIIYKMRDTEELAK